MRKSPRRDDIKLPLVPIPKERPVVSPGTYPSLEISYLELHGDYQLPSPRRILVSEMLTVVRELTTRLF